MSDLLKTTTEVGFGDPVQFMVLQELIPCVTEKSPGKQSELLIINQARNAFTSVHYRFRAALCKS